MCIYKGHKLAVYKYIPTNTSAKCWNGKVKLKKAKFLRRWGMEFTRCIVCKKLIKNIGLPFCSKYCFNKRPNNFFDRYSTIQDIQSSEREAENGKRKLFR